MNAEAPSAEGAAPASTAADVSAALAWIVATLCAAAFAVVIPFGRGPDEHAHAGHMGFLAREGRIPDLRRDDVFQGHHPPLYYATLAGVRAALPKPGSDAASRPATTLEVAGRRITISGDVVPDPSQGPTSGLPIGATAPVVYAFEPHLWRALGAAAYALAAGVLLFAARRAFPGDRRTATWTAAAVVAVPGAALAASTVNNDAFAVLFATLGVAAACRGAESPHASRFGAAWSGLWFGLGFLTKLSVAGPFATAAVLFAFAPGRTVGTRARDLALLTAGPALIAGWWIVPRYLGADAGVASEFFAARHPGILRLGAPDAAGLCDVPGVLALSWLGFSSGDGLHPGWLWILCAAALPLAAVFGGAAAVVGRDAPSPDRRFAAAFLVGAATQCGLIVVGNAELVQVHGRYVAPLALPAALAAAAGLRRLCGGRAHVVASGIAAVVAAGGPLLLFGAVLPRYAPPSDRFATPDFAAYVDVGSPAAAAAGLRGAPWSDPNLRSDRAEGTALVDPAEVRVRLPRLDPQGLYWVGLRAARTNVEPVVMDFRANGLPLLGPYSPISRDAPWRWAPLPSAAGGAAEVSARALVGGAANLAEILVRKLPLAVEAVRTTDGGLGCVLRSTAPDRLPPLTASFAAADAATPPEPVRFDADGAARPTGGLPPTARNASLRLTTPELSWADVKAAALAAPGAAVRGLRRTPGLFVVAADGGTPAGTPLVALPTVVLDPGTYRLELFDADGAALAAGVVALDDARGGAPREAQGAAFDAGTNLPPAVRLLVATSRPLTLDRVVLRRDVGWVVPLVAPR
jgi:hypothetical protein